MLLKYPQHNFFTFYLLLLGSLIIAPQAVRAQVDQFNPTYRQLVRDHINNNAVSYQEIDIQTSAAITKQISTADIDILTKNEKVAFLINAYNALVISQVLEYYPINSVAEVGGFFTKKHQVGPRTMSLNELEQEILNLSADPYTHLLLNCGAVSCPEVQFIEAQIDRSVYYIKALAAKQLLDQHGGVLLLSKIFEWYAADFGSQDELIDGLSELTELDKEEPLTIKYQSYDWLLNGKYTASIGVYYPTRLYPKGGGEVKVFNNYYTQLQNGVRSNFFSSFLQVLIGTSKNYNFGFDVKLRSVSSGAVRLFSALEFNDQPFADNNGVRTFSRAGISGIGPRIKYQPFKNKPNINFLHTVYFVPMQEAEGNDNYGYVDYDYPQIFNQVFVEKELSRKSRLFIDLGLHIENLRLNAHRNYEHFTPIQVPITVIYNYFIDSKTTIYGLGAFAQRFDIRFRPDTDTYSDHSVYGQLGVGAKHILHDLLEIELLYTNFLLFNDTPAHTFNLGIRFYKW